MSNYYSTAFVLLCFNLYLHDSHEDTMPSLKIRTINTFESRIKLRPDHDGIFKMLEKFSNSRSIVTAVNVENLKNDLAAMEASVLRLTDEMQKTKEKEKMKQFVETILPQLCQYIYDNGKFDVRLDLKTVSLNMRKNHFLKNDYYIPLIYNSTSSELPQIYLGREIMLKFRHKNSLCLGTMLFEGDHFNAKQKVHGVKLYTTDSESALDATNMQEFSVIVDLPSTKTELSRCSMLNGNNGWDPSKCITLSLSPTIIKCGCKALGYYTVLSNESPSTIQSGNGVTQQLMPTISTVLTTFLSNKVAQGTAVIKPTSTTNRPQSTKGDLTIEQVDMMQGNRE